MLGEVSSNDVWSETLERDWRGRYGIGGIGRTRMLGKTSEGIALWRMMVKGLNRIRTRRDRKIWWIGSSPGGAGGWGWTVQDVGNGLGRMGETLVGGANACDTSGERQISWKRGSCRIPYGPKRRLVRDRGGEQRVPQELATPSSRPEEGKDVREGAHVDYPEGSRRKSKWERKFQWVSPHEFCTAELMNNEDGSEADGREQIIDQGRYSKETAGEKSRGGGATKGKKCRGRCGQQETGKEAYQEADGCDEDDDDEDEV